MITDTALDMLLEWMLHVCSLLFLRKIVDHRVEQQLQNWKRRQFLKEDFRRRFFTDIG